MNYMSFVGYFFRETSMAKKPVQPSFEEWFKGQLRFGLNNDTVIIFVPSHDRNGARVTKQDIWAEKTIQTLGRLYGGATGFKDLIGVWVDDDGKVYDDTPMMIQSLAKRIDTEDLKKVEELGKFCKEMGKDLKQKSIGVIFNDAIHFIQDFS